MREIASLLGQSESAVSAHLSRGRKSLRTPWEGIFMNREYNDNKMYNSALDELRFSDEAKSRMVNRLMAAAEQPEQPVAIHRVRRFPRIAAVGVAAALVLSIGAGATGVFKSASDAFAGVFGPTADTEIIDQIGHPIGASDTAGGVTVTADAILFDGYNYLISYTLEKEDGSAFDCTKNPDTGLYDLYWKRSDSTIGRGVDGASGSSYFYDENPSDNAIQYVETMSYNDAVQTGGTVKITLGDLCVLNSETVSDNYRQGRMAPQVSAGGREQRGRAACGSKYRCERTERRCRYHRYLAHRLPCGVHGGRRGDVRHAVRRERRRDSAGERPRTGRYVQHMGVLRCEAAGDQDGRYCARFLGLRRQHGPA